MGLAGTLTGLGLLVVYARRVLPRVRLDGRLAAGLPAVSALAIVVARLLAYGERGAQCRLTRSLYFWALIRHATVRE